MMGFQAEGAPIVRGHIVEEPETIATAIRIGNPASWKFAEAARDESNGHIGMISDDNITKYQQLLAQKDGVFCEPHAQCQLQALLIWQKRIPLSHRTKLSPSLPDGLRPDHAISVSNTPAVVDTYAAVSDAIFRPINETSF